MKKTTAPNPVQIEVICRPEDLPIEGNASAIDPKTDARIARWIRKQLDAGNEWAWCAVEVRASIGNFSASDYLGGCSYKSERDFMRGGYYEDMVHMATAALIEQIDSAYSQLHG